MEFQKYTLIQIEELIDQEWGKIGTYISKPCFDIIQTFDTLKEVREEQKKYSFGTIILPSY